LRACAAGRTAAAAARARAGRAGAANSSSAAARGAASGTTATDRAGLSTSTAALNAAWLLLFVVARIAARELQAEHEHDRGTTPSAVHAAAH
jgi:hypothetical protein